MRIPILPDETRCPLDQGQLPGAVAVLRPLDQLAVANHRQGVLDGMPVLVAARATVRRQLLRIEGLEVGETAEGAVPFDPGSDAHWRALPYEAVDLMDRHLWARAALTEAQAKNSDSPSASAVTTATGN